MSDNVTARDSFFQKYISPPAEPEQEEGLPSLTEKEYRPHARPSNKPLHSIHFITPDGDVRSFQYVHLDSNSQFTGGRIVLRFMGIGPIAVTIEGRNLWRMYDYIHQHRIAWVVQAARDFAGDGQARVACLRFLPQEDRV